MKEKNELEIQISHTIFGSRPTKFKLVGSEKFIDSMMGMINKYWGWKRK